MRILGYYRANVKSLESSINVMGASLSSKVQVIESTHLEIIVRRSRS